MVVAVEVVVLVVVIAIALVATGVAVVSVSVVVGVVSPSPSWSSSSPSSSSWRRRRRPRRSRSRPRPRPRPRHRRGRSSPRCCCCFSSPLLHEEQQVDSSPSCNSRQLKRSFTCDFRRVSPVIFLTSELQHVSAKVHKITCDFSDFGIGFGFQLYCFPFLADSRGQARGRHLGPRLVGMKAPGSELRRRHQGSDLELRV